MERNELYVMKVEYDPEGIFQKGARIPYSEFLIGVKMNVYSPGMRVSKVAGVSDFTVAISEKGANILLDDKKVPWYIEDNHGNSAYIQARRYGNRSRKVAKA